MISLDGTLCRCGNNITIKLNNLCGNGKLYYMDKVGGEETYLMDVINTKEVTFEDPKPMNRTFYKIKEGNSEVVLAERVVPLKGFSNFRDLGGYETVDGRRVKWGLFYRSEDLSRLNKDNLDYFKSLEIKYVLDYRSSFEEEENPDVKVDGTKNINISALENLDNDNLDMVSYIKSIIKGNKITVPPETLLMESYESLPFNNKAYKELFQLLRNPENTAILQHCTAGKDRTGVGSALILIALGVPESTVFEDYLESNIHRENANKEILALCDKYFKDLETKTLMENVLSVKKEYLEKSLNCIKEKYNSYEKYFNEEYGLNKDDLEKLKEYYLY